MTENPAVNLHALRNSFAKFACFSSELIVMFLMRAAAAKVRAINSPRATTFIL
jgi:hypothetical protein